MKKVLFSLLMLFMFSANAQAFDYIKDNQYVYYNPHTHKWSEKQTSDKDISLRYKMFVGSGGFSEYYNNKGKLAIGPFTNMEFLNNGDFVGVDNANLKFYKYVYKNGFFEPVLLSEDYVKSLFPNVEIIKISEFKDNEITIYKDFMKSKEILLLNDTKKNFYKYSYKPAKVKSSNITGLLELKDTGKIKFSYYGSDSDLFPALKIHVKTNKK